MFQLTNKAQDVLNLVRSGGAIDTSILGTVGNVQGQMQAAIGQLSAIPGNLAGQAVSKLSELTGAGGMFGQLQEHMQGQFSNLTRNLNLYIGNFSALQGTGAIPAFPSATLAFAQGVGSEAAPNTLGDICQNVNDFFGSIIGLGQELLGQITGFIGEIVGKVQELIGAIMGGVQAVIDAALGAINAVVEQIQAVANQVIEMIQREVEAIAEALRNMLDLSNTFSFLNIFNHPCAKVVLGAVGTGGLLAALNR